MTLSEQTQTLARLSTQATSWVAHHAPEAGPDALVDLRRQGRIARRLAVAASRPPAVAVYGASQAGKSYLMSGLSSPAEGPFLISYGDRQLDYLLEINPSGGDESSGLVSRFTLHAPRSPNPQFSVPVKLLSISDIIRIIGNTFLSDFRIIENKEKPETIPLQWNALAERLEALPRADGQGVFTIDDVEVLREYFERKFGDKNWISALTPAYWDWMGRTIATLPLHAAIMAFSPLWGHTQYLTDYATQLVRALVELGQPELAFCGVDALVPRAVSILNVMTLFQTTVNAQSLTLLSSTGASATLPRNIVSALVSELVVPMQKARWDFMQTTDLLDFPGARSRLEISDVAKGSDIVGKLFLRGKVDYLFELYQTDMEVTSLLLCVADSAQEVTGLPRMIESWIHSTLGKTARDRASQADSLFVILTKFDRQFEGKAGADDNSTETWDMRLNASLINFFKAPWVDEWKPGQPFNNVQWLRAASAGDLYRKDSRGTHETEMLPDVKARVERRRAAYLRSEPVLKHIANYEKAFDQALLPNDGGISYLAERLRPLCANNTKNEQLAARMHDCASAILALTARYYHDPDSMNATEEAQQALGAIANELSALYHNRMFGPFLLHLSLPRETIIREWRNFSSDIETTPPQPATTSLLSGILNIAQAQAAPAKDQHDQFAEQVMSVWVEERLNAFMTDPVQAAAFGMKPHTIRPFIERLEKLADTLGIEKTIAERLRLQCSHNNALTQSGEKQAVICAEIIGRFVTYLGYETMPEDARPALPANGRAIFSRPEAPVDFPQLPEKPAVYLDNFFQDWVLGLLRRLEEGGPNFDIEANKQLGTILDTLEPLKS